jgi:hypothetical protein
VAALFVCENPDVDQAGASSGALARSRAGPDEFPVPFQSLRPTTPSEGTLEDVLAPERERADVDAGSVDLEPRWVPAL